MSDMESNAQESVSVEPVIEDQDNTVQETEQSDVDSSDEGEENGESAEQKRPGKVARKLTWLEAQVAAKDQEIQRLKNPQQKAEPKEAPKMEDFDDVFDFLDARDDWKHEQRALKQNETVNETQEQAEILSKKNVYDQRLVSFVGSNQELAQNIVAMDQSGLVTEAMELSIYESPIGEKITAHLAENPEVVVALSRLPEKQQYRVMGAIEAYVAAQGKTTPKASTPPPQEERQTQAAPPITPPKSTAAKSTTPLWDLPQAEFEKRMQQMRKR